MKKGEQRELAAEGWIEGMKWWNGDG